MANLDFSNNLLSTLGAIVKLLSYSEFAIIGKSSLGKVARENLDLPALTSNLEET
jgi:hypothetical protein